ncbi:MAG: discoidin domain-containing protein, partial [Clostridia bacterium]|nr:discoidin domain-containing protein [Clostridia bacterium]
KKSRTYIAAAIVAAVLFSFITLLGTKGTPNAVKAADNGGEIKNIALNQTITATSNYVPPEGFFDVSLLVDGHWDTYANGNVKLGWNSDTMSPMGEYDPVDITLTLDAKYDVSRIVLKPMQWLNGDGFPKNYELQYSVDGENWTTLITEEEKSTHAESNTAVQPVIYEIDRITMQYFRIHITRHAKLDPSGAYYSSLGELELYGTVSKEENVKTQINKKALLLNPGEQDWLDLHTVPGNDRIAARYESSNSKIVKVDADGTVSALAEGNAVITVTSEADGEIFSCDVTVKEFKPSSKFQIVAFIPYFYGSEVNETTFDNLKNGGITNVELNFALGADAITYDNIIKALSLAYERGLDVTVSEKQFTGATWPSFTDEQILEFVKRYSHIPGVAAYYITDEPATSTQFARAISLIKSVMPYAVAHMNYCGAYKENITGLQNELKNKYGLSLDYAMYDAYCFTTPVCNEGTLYTQLAYNREVSRELGIPGATYIQAMNWNQTYRPNADEVRYQVFAALASGVKQISYFCWKTPAANSAETYGPAVIDIDNNPTELFGPVSEINARVQALGPTLMKLETIDLYHTGADFGAGFNALPAGFFVKPADYEQKLALSHMEDADGRVYCMIVNRDYKNPAEVRFTLDKDVASVSYISDVTGEPVTMTPGADGVYTVSLKAGDGILLKAADSYKFVMKEETNYYYLNKAIEDAEKVDLGKYKPAGKEAFTEALAEAKRVAADGTATQKQADKAKNSLVKAQNNLKPYAEDGVNLALHKKVSAANSYEDGTYFSRSYLTDGINVTLDKNTHAGWSVDSFSGVGPEDPVEVKVDLEDPYLLDTVILKPCAYNGGASAPRDFKVLVSDDGKEWTEVASVEGLELDEAIDLKYTFEPIEGRYVKVAISRHSAQVDRTGTSLSQFGEIEVYGRELTAETPAAATDVPATEPPAEPTDEPATDAPAEPTDVPATESGTTAEPVATDQVSEPTSSSSQKQTGKGNAGLIAGVIAAVALIATGVTAAVVIRKKKQVNDPRPRK